jgi:uncharacterized membrane protein YfcA
VDIGWSRHPHAERPLIDYEVKFRFPSTARISVTSFSFFYSIKNGASMFKVSTFMQSGELLGVTLGVLLNLMLPEVVIMVFLALLLSFNAYKTITKGMAKYQKETDVITHVITIMI